MIEFAHIELFGLLLLPALMLLSPAFFQRQTSVRVPFFDRVAQLTGQKKKKASLIKRRDLIQKILVSFSWICLVTAAARPELVGEPIEQIKSGRDLMVAVDLSGSMAAEDFSRPGIEPITRLDAVKDVLKDFVEEREHDRLGLILFGDAPYLQVPFSEDKTTWLTLLDETEIGMAGQSTVFGDAIGLSIKLFDASESERRTLLVLTDGNDTGSLVPPVEAAQIAASHDIRIYVIAVGDPATVGEDQLDIETIARVADVTGGRYFEALDQQQLLEVSDTISQLEKDTYETLSYSPRTSLHYYPLIPVALLYLLYHVGMAVRLFRQKAIQATPGESVHV